MLVALIIINVFLIIKKRSDKNNILLSKGGGYNSSSPLFDEMLPFHPETNLEQFVGNMAKLLNCKILIRKSSISTTLNARPVIRSLFGRREQRRYVIRINTRQDFDGVKIEEVPLDAKIGLWFHELMHIKDYQSRSIIGIIQRGLQYLTVAGKRMFEHEIDRMVIMSGYGRYLYRWSQYSMQESTASEKYKAFKSMIYLTPEQIQKEISARVVLHSYNSAS